MNKIILSAALVAAMAISGARVSFAQGAGGVGAGAGAGSARGAKNTKTPSSTDVQGKKDRRR